MSVAEKLTTIAENQQKVYDAGYTKGKAEGGGGGDTDSAYQEGKEAERQAVWNAIQNYGNRTLYNYAFYCTRHTKESFRPLYDIRPTSAENMFGNCATLNAELFSMTDVENACGIVFDFSNCTNFGTSFMRCPFNEVNVIDVSKSTSMYQMFYNDNKLKRINRLIFSENTVIGWGAFLLCSELEYVGFEGTIAQSISLKDSPLNRQSLQKLIAALSGTTTGLTATVKKTAAEAAFTTDEWNALVATKPNWTITLA